MGILSALTGEGTPFRWTFTEQRAFDEVRDIVEQARDLARIAIDYRLGAPPVNLVTDGCSIGIAGCTCISQGDDWRTAPMLYTIQNHAATMYRATPRYLYIIISSLTSIDQQSPSTYCLSIQFFLIARDMYILNYNIKRYLISVACNTCWILHSTEGCIVVV